MYRLLMIIFICGVIASLAGRGPVGCRGWRSRISSFNFVKTLVSWSMDPLPKATPTIKLCAAIMAGNRVIIGTKWAKEVQKCIWGTPEPVGVNLVDGPAKRPCHDHVGPQSNL
jgi:hypothetical protein